MAIINQVASNLAYEFYLAGLEDGEDKKTRDEYWAGLSDYFKVGYLMQAVWVFENYIEERQQKPKLVECFLLPGLFKSRNIRHSEVKYGEKTGS